jgi:predicted regulator of Ras-like GTPase activity (Roadblock/LC7/MglB family)
MEDKTLDESLQEIMENAISSTNGLEATAIVSMDGMIIGSVLPEDVEEERIAAMTAAILGLGERTAEEMQRGTLEEIYIKGEGGYVLILGAGESVVLTGIVSNEAKLGLLFISMKNTAKKIAEVLSG